MRDIARMLNVGMPSVSVALRALAQRGLVNYDPYQLVTLTDHGQKLGREIDSRHQVLEDFFRNVLDLDSQTARENACRMEHAIDKTVLDRLELLACHIQRNTSFSKVWAKTLKSQDPASPCLREEPCKT